MVVKAIQRTGLLYLLIGPAGAGKNTLLEAWRKRAPELGRILSATTRPPRGRERNGRDYVFLTRSQFEAGIKKSRFAEWAEIHKGANGRGDLYGKPRQPILKAIAKGQDLATDIDIQGARSLAKAFPRNVVTIFILPPSAAEIKKRLKARGTESAQRIRTRLTTAKAELAAMGEFDYLVINDTVTHAVSELVAIRRAERHRLSRVAVEKIQRAFKL